MPESNLSLYFSSNLVTVMDEVLGYDWNNFISDMGGSLGFLLGLSVIGALSLVEQIFLLIFHNRFCKRNKADKLEQQNTDVPIIKIDCQDEEKRILQKNEKNNNNNNSAEYYNNIKKAQNQHNNIEKY